MDKGDKVAYDNFILIYYRSRTRDGQPKKAES